jgi:hypothetical protein
MKPILIIKQDKSLAILNVCAFTGISGYMAYNCRQEFFDWRDFHPSARDTIVFLLLLGLTSLLWVILVKDLPQLKFDATGIWKPQHFLSHSLQLIVSWENVSYYTTRVKPSRSLPTEDLIIRMKEPDEPIAIGITDSDKSRDQILAVLKSYSEQYGFNDFVDEPSMGK